MHAVPKLEETLEAESWTGASAVEEMLKCESLNCLNQDLASQEVKIGEPNRSGPIYGHRLGVILLAGPEIRLTLKAFFNIQDIQYILSRKMGRPVALGSGNLFDDYVREYLNRLAGVGKRSLGESGLNVGISLPIVTRGFDEAFSNPAGSTETTAVWGVRDQQCGLIVSVASFVKDGAAVGRFSFVNQNEPVADEMEFL